MELVIASSFLPFFGYLAVTIGKQTVCILYYGTKEGTIDPQLTSLAKEKNRRVSKVIVKDVDLKNAYASNFDGSIILTRKLVDVLSDDETEAILYHEISHISTSPAPVRVLAIIFVLPVLLLFLYSVFCFVFSVLLNLVHQFEEAFYLGLFVPSFIFCMILLIVERKGSWAAEYDADAKAADKAGATLIIAALEKMIPPERRDCDSPTHPSLRRRVAAIRTHCNQSDTHE